MNLLDILTPLYLLIGLGFLLNKYQFPNKDFWPGIERMSYFVLFPTLIFVALIKAEIDLSLIGIIVLVVLIPSSLSGLLQWLGLLSPKLSSPSFSSMFQGAVRNNTVVSLVIVAWLLPDTGLAIMSVIILVMVPMNNFLATFVLLRYGRPSTAVSASWWKGLVANPLIIACFLGLSFNILNIDLPRSFINTADFLGRSALPFALLAVGAGLKLDSAFKNKFMILFPSISKLLIVPLLSWALCVLFEVERDVAMSAIVFGSMPTAVSCYILAKQMGGDAEGMAQIITFQTLMAAFTLPLFLVLAQQF